MRLSPGVNTKYSCSPDRFVYSHDHDDANATADCKKDAPAEDLGKGVSWVKTNYDDVPELTRTLNGVHTVLSFLAGPTQPRAPGQTSTQINLIDASIRAGVKRFAPSEWAM